MTISDSHDSITTTCKKLISTIAVIVLFLFTSGVYAAQACFTYTGAIENWVVPANVTTIAAEAWGAQGGNSTYRNPSVAGGLGAYMSGDITVTPGDSLKVLVGGQGESLSVGGGGGGSFLSSSLNAPLLVAGGGGGASSDQVGVGAVTTEAGTADSVGAVAGGTGGNGGSICQIDNNDGGGGGGFFTDGATANAGGSTNGGFGGIAFVNGGTIVPGGRLDNACNGNDSAGGFGGGGSATCNTVGGGGGGGYSGGGGGQHINSCTSGPRAGGGGGGSFNAGINQLNTPATRSGNGEVCITYSNVASFTVGGTVTGLLGTGLTLQNNAGDDLAVSADGSFTFSTPLVDNSSYVVTVLNQPVNPAQICSVTNESGTLSGANVTNIGVSCQATLGAASIPTLSIWSLGLLIVLLGLIGYKRQRI